MTGDRRTGTDPESRSAGRQVVLLGLPLLVGALSAAMSGVVDAAMMGRYGAADLAAVSGASALFDLFSAVVLASVLGHQILAPRFAGREDPPGIARSLRTSAWFSGGIAAALALACLLAGGPLTGLVVGGDPELRRIGGDYLAARAGSLLLLAAFALLVAIFNAYRRPRYGMVAGIAVNVANIGLDALLIYGPGPFPRLGAVGNGLATTLAWLVGLAALLLVARGFRLAELLRRPGPGTPVDFETSVPKLSWPAIVSTALDYVAVAVFFAIIGGLGAAALGGGRIAYEVLLLLFAVGAAFAAGARILVGRAAGAGRFGEAQAFWRSGQRVLLGPAVLIAAALALLADPVARLFSSFPPVVDAAGEAMPLVAVCLPLLAWTLGNVSVLRALGRTTWDMYANLLAALAVQLPVGWLLAEAAGLGLAGAYGGVVGYWVTRAAATELLARRAVREEARTAAAAAVPEAGLPRPS